MRPSIYYLYNEASTQDAKLCHELENWIYGLYRDERHTTRWHRVLPGGELRLERLRHMQEADVVLILLSPDFLGEDEYHQRALEALALRARGTVVIPIVVRPIPALSGIPTNELQILPRNGVPVSRWRKRDDAWEHICNEMRALLEQAPKRPLFPANTDGATIGQYRILHQIGSGGTGEVFLAQHFMFGRPAAIKIARPDAKAQLDIKWEAAMLHAAAHPGVVTLYDAALLPDGRPYLVLEWLEGQALDHEFETLPPPKDVKSWERRLRLVQQVAKAMTELHSRDLVHCDLKPSNILLCNQAGPMGRIETAKILDFGTARLRQTTKPTVESKLVESGVIHGTANYISPELILGKGDVSGKVDVYSLGVILFEACTGRLPIESGHLATMLASVVFEISPSIASINHTSTPIVTALVANMLAKEPAERPTMHDVAQILEDAIHEITNTDNG